MHKLLFPTSLLLLAPSASAALFFVRSLDTFTEGDPALRERSGTHQQLFETTSGTIPGDWRAIELSITSNPDFRTANVGVSSIAGEYFAQLGPNLTADLALEYDGNGAGLGGLDLTENDESHIGVTVADSDPSLMITVILTDTNNQTATFDVTVANAISGSTLVDLPYASFSNFANTDFTQIESMRYEFDNGTSGDFTFDMLGLYSQVPEPATPLLAGMALSLGLARRLRSE